LAEQVWAISEGNPFLAVEMLRNLQEEKASSTLDLRNAPMPQRVRDLLVRRLERLKKQAQLLVAAAAVIGHEFDFQLLHCVTGLTEAAIAHDLEELVRRRIFTALARSLTSRTSAYVRLRSTELCRHSATCFNAISRKR
jgi:predicted ATPase